GPFAASVSREVPADHLHPDAVRRNEAEARKKAAEEETRAKEAADAEDRKKAEAEASEQARAEALEKQQAAEAEAAQRREAESYERREHKRAAIESAEAVLIRLRQELVAAEHELVKAQRMPD